MLQYARALRERGGNVKIIVFPEDVHAIDRFMMQIFISIFYCYFGSLEMILVCKNNCCPSEFVVVRTQVNVSILIIFLALLLFYNFTF